MNRWWVLLAIALLLVPEPSGATGPEHPPPAVPPGVGVVPAAGASVGDLFGAMAESGKIGEWVELATLKDGGLDLGSTMRLLLLADEDPKKPAWLEFWMGKTGQMAVRVQMVGAEGGSAAMFVKMGTAFWSIDAAAAPGAGTCQGPVCRGAEPGKPLPETKRVSVKTLAGTFECVYSRKKTADGIFEIWYSDQVPALGLVRVKPPRGSGMELVAFGRQGSSAFPRGFKSSPLPFQNLDGIMGLVPKTAPKGSPPACDPKTASCPEAVEPARSAEPAKVPGLPVYEPKQKR